MGIEIERRFLVKNENWKRLTIFSEDFIQGYLNSNPEDLAVRIRISNHKEGFLTLKSSIDGLINNEFEYPIPIKDAYELIELSKYKLTKTRYQLKINNKYWIVDSFKNLNSPLVLAEIELKSPSEKVEIPSWCGREITGIKSLSNAFLAKTPISSLSLNDRLKAKHQQKGNQSFRLSL